MKEQSKYKKKIINNEMKKRKENTEERREREIKQNLGNTLRQLMIASYGYWDD